jgi:hypothetical protein
MRFIKNLSSGTYGHTCLFENENKERMLLKMSNTIDFRMRHEFQIMTELESIGCSTFCKPIFLHTKKVKSIYLTSGKGNPFDIGKKGYVNTEVCAMEYINGNVIFEDIIRDSLEYDLDVVMSIIKQVLCAISMAHEKIGFTHYDLHTDNIMIEPCDKDESITFTIQDDTITVPTLGCKARIIDFGFSFTYQSGKNSIQTPIMFPQYGYTSNVSDPVSDCKVFLISILFELDKYRKHQDYSVFRNIVKNLFLDGGVVSTIPDSERDQSESESDSDDEEQDKKINYSNGVVDTSNGWNRVVKYIAYDGFVSSISNIVMTCSDINEDNIFVSTLNECVDILQYGVVLPLRSKKSKGLKICIRAFLKEWHKFDVDLGSNTKKLTMLKLIVEESVQVRSTALSDFKEGVVLFKNSLLNQQFFKFYYPKNVDYAKLLGSLYLVYDCIENVLYVDYKKCSGAIEYKYAKSSKQIFDIINSNYQEL